MPLSRIEDHIKFGGKRISMSVMTLAGGENPRLRFDKVAVGLVKRLQASLSKSVPVDKTVVVTVTAPIRQDSKTAAALEGKIQELLTAGRTRLEATIHGNRIQVRILAGGAGRTSKLIGFVHNPEPDPKILFEVTHSLLECIGSGKSGGERWLIIAAEIPGTPIETVQQVCSALRAERVFKRVLLARS